MNEKQLEIFGKIEKVKNNFVYNKNELDILVLSEILIDLEENILNINQKKIDEFMFNFNNSIRKERKTKDIDIRSYNIGIAEFFSKLISFQKIKNYEDNYVKLINDLSEKQEEIIKIIYYEDGINSKKIRNLLNITSQHLYNLTHDDILSKLLIINDSHGGKFKHYSLTMNCRKYLDKKFSDLNKTEKVDNEFREVRYKSVSNKEMIPENVGYKLFLINEYNDNKFDDKYNDYNDLIIKNYLNKDIKENKYEF